MKSGLKILLSAIVPMVALVSTSCGESQTIGFNLALKYASEHFDENSLDTVPTDYTFEVNEFGLDLDVNFIDVEGASEDLKIAFGLDNISVVIRDLYAYCMSSTMISQIQSNYSLISGLVMESFTKIPVDLTYQLENGGMRVRLGTNNAFNNVVDFVRLGVAALSAISYLPSESSYQEMAIDALCSLFGNGAKETISTIVKYMGMGLQISVDPSSSSVNDIFEAVVSCNKYGYIDNGNIKLNGDIDLGLIVATSETIRQELPFLVDIDGRYSFKGNIGIELSACAEFTNK